MGLFREFREFAVKGNMFDMAVGIMIGAAFGTVVSSLVDDILFPLISSVGGGVEFGNRAIELRSAEIAENGQVLKEAIFLNYGEFVQALLDFLLIAFSLFFMIRLINRLKRRSEDTEDDKTPTPKHIQLLTEIRDEMRKKG